MTISYREGMKYQLTNPGIFQLDFAPKEDIATEFIKFLRTGVLVIREGYAWDGPSGPTFDDETNMQGSLIHDALYQLMRMGLLDDKIYRPLADKCFARVCEIDGMNHMRASIYFAGVHEFGMHYAQKQQEKIITCGQPINLLVACQGAAA